MADQPSSTIKLGKDYDAPWVVVTGNPEEQAKYLVAYFGLKELPEEVTPFEVLLEAVGIAQGGYSALKGLGARPTTQKASEAVTGQPGASDAWSRASTPAEPAAPHQNVLDLIAASTAKAQLQEIYVDYPEAMKDEAVMAALQAKSGEVA